jgi:hypothetical protein
MTQISGKNIFKYSILVQLLWFSMSVSAQQSTVLMNNPELKWYQINTTHFRVIFPQGFAVQGNRMANTLEALHAPEANTLGSLPTKIPIVLQNQSSISNAFVSITPRRSEFYTMPSQNYNFTGTNDWLNLIASHEYRHIVQFQHARRGLNKVLYYLFGNNTLALSSYIAVPQWFWEGDAVATETAFTPSGRGRIPQFNLVFKTNLLEGRSFNYNKQFLRSYKHNIPDHYVLGYNMVSYLRKRSGDADVWGKVTASAWNVPFMPFTFSKAIKKEAGLYVKDLYTEMAKDLQKEWRQQIDTLKLTPYEKLNTRRNTVYTDYEYPHELEDGSILAVKSGIGDIEKLVVLRDGKEKEIYTPGVVNNTGMLSATNLRMVWNEFRYDPRWRMRTYSVIVGYDIGNKSKKIISKNSRYTSAAISKDGYKVATIENTLDYKTRLVVLDYFSGSVIKEFDNPSNNFLSMPRWDNHGKSIYALSSNKDGKALIKIDFESGAVTTLTNYTQENIGYPMPYNEYVFFNSPRSGIDNIYALHEPTSRFFQITSSKYGAYNPTVSKDEKLIYYNEQGKDGLDVVKTDFDSTKWTQVSEFISQPDLFADLLTEQEHDPDLLKNVSDKVHPVSRYSKTANLFNPYSWGLYFNDDLTQADIGISSQDVLSNLRLSTGYRYDINERTGSWNTGISYQGLYPIIDVNLSAATRSVNEGDVPTEDWLISRQNDTTKVRSARNITFSWKEKTVEAGLRVPLLTTKSKYLSSLTVSNYVGYTHVSDFKNSATSERYFPAVTRYDTVDRNGNLFARTTILNVYPFFDYSGNGKLVYNNFNLSFFRLLKQSRRDINSKWGQAAFINLYNTVGSKLNGGLFAFTGYLYFPGLAKHHSLNGYWSYQNTLIDTSSDGFFDNYFFRNRIPLPRGQAVNRFKEFYSMSVNYALPIFYPDLAIGPLVNFQRLRANFFLDYGYGKSRIFDEFNQSYLSAGAELKFDINVLRLLPQLDVGFRYSYGLSPSTTRFEFLLGTFNF